MKAIQNIHQQLTQALTAISIWSDSLCSDVIMGFSGYNNEPKQTKTGI
jgi:hypothetical protein